MEKSEVKSQHIYGFIKKFKKSYGLEPPISVISKYFSITPHTVYRKFKILEKNKQIIRIKKDKYNTNFEIQ